MTFSTKTLSQKALILPVRLAISMVVFFLTNAMNVNAQTSAIPATPGPINGQTNVCAFVGTNQDISYSIDQVPGATLYLWTVPPTATLISGQGTTSIQVSFSNAFTSAANKQLRVRSIAQAGNSADRILYLASQQPSTPNAINGPSNACIFIGTNNQATYSVARDAAASGYIWGFDPASTVVTHPNGAGVNDTVVNVVFKNGFKTSSVSVQSLNNCGFSAARLLTVAGSAPSTPGPITGPTNGCPYMLPNGAVATYTINPVAGATAYAWITPANCVVTHPNGAGSGDISITVQYPPDFVSGSISVIASSGCDDSSPRTLAISKLNAGTPGVITPVEQSICPEREWVYKLPAMPSNATSVNWTVPVDALSFSGQGSATISVLYPSTRVSGIVTATGVNNCGTSATRQATINLFRCQNERMSGNSGRSANRGNGDSNEENAQENSLNANKTQVQQVKVDGIKINVAPNPSKGDFKLKVLTESKDIINIKLLDLQGRELKKLNIVQGQSLSFGNELKPGTYIIEVSQGRLKQTQKILKL